MDKRVVNVVVTNREASLVWPIPDDLNEALRDFWSYSIPNAFFTQKYKDGVWDGRKRMFSRGKLGTGLFLATYKDAEEEFNVKFQIHTRITEPAFKQVDLSSARDYQVSAFGAMRLACMTGGGIIRNATGTGKTFIAAIFFKALVGRGVFVVDELSLLHQAREAIHAVVGEPIGIIGESEFQPNRITVATIQTLFLRRNDPVFKRWHRTLDVMFIDELHVHLNHRNFKVLKSIKPRVVFGLTATLQLNKKEVWMQAYALAGPVIFDYPLEQATEEGFLTSGIVVQLGITYSQISSNNYIIDYSDLMEQEERMQAVEELTRIAIAEGRTVVLLVRWVKHLKMLHKRLRDVPHFLVYGQVESPNSRLAKQSMDKGDIKLIIANDVFAKGIDIKRVDFIINAAADKHPNTAIQKYGRGVRLAVGKNALVYFDIADRSNRFSVSANARRKAFLKEKIKIFTVPYDRRILAAVVRRAIQLSNNEKSKLMSVSEGEYVKSSETKNDP